jgi:cytochrome c6
MLKTTVRRLQTALKRGVLLMIAFGSFLALWGTSPAIAADLDAGKRIFSANCAACHAGGNNVVAREKNLKKEALEQFAMNNLEAIQTQVTKGKGMMPAFGNKLSADDITNVASYVLDQAEKGW